MKPWTTTMSESVQQKMDGTDLDHGRPRFSITLLVLTRPSTATMPGVRPLHAPEFRQGRKTLGAGWTCLPCDAPAGTGRSHPGVPRVMVRLLRRTDRDQTRHMVGVDVAEQERWRHPSIQPGPGAEHGEHQAQRIAPQMPRAPLDVFATIIPPLRASHLGSLDRLTVEAHDTGRGGAPSRPPRPFAHHLDQRGPCPLVAPRPKVVLDGPLGPPSVRPQSPWAAPVVQGEQRRPDFPPGALPRTPSSWAALGRGEPRGHDRPWLLRER